MHGNSRTGTPTRAIGANEYCSDDDDANAITLCLFYRPTIAAAAAAAGPGSDGVTVTELQWQRGVL